MPTIVGAGAIGLALGARLARSGLGVRFVTRREAAARALREHGVEAEDPSSGERFQAPVEAVAGPGSLGTDDGPILLCVRLPDVEAVGDALAALHEPPAVVAFQNDVEAEPRLAARGLQVVGGVWRQTCTRVDDRSVRLLGRGRAILGRHPEGHTGAVDTAAGWLRAAGFDVGVSRRIGDDKWLKLCVNLMSAPNALVRRSDHQRAAFVETKVRLLEEARAVLARAGIAARSCDGRDRSLDEEIAFQAGSLARGDSARPLPIYNQVWASLRGGGPSEAPAYHRRFVSLGRRHGVPTPTNARVLEVLERALGEGLGPESVAAEELLPQDPGAPAGGASGGGGGGTPSGSQTSVSGWKAFQASQ